MNGGPATFATAHFGRLKKMIKGNKSLSNESLTTVAFFEVNFVDGSTLSVDLRPLLENLNHNGELLVKVILCLFVILISSLNKIFVLLFLLMNIFH